MTVRILVTGVEGQLARALVERAAGRNDVAVVCLGRPHLDLMQVETIAAAIGAARPDVVIGAAAYTAVDKAEDESEAAFRVNGEAAAMLARAARQAGGRFIQISTDYVYDGRKAAPYVESDPTGPQNVYGRSKLVGERRALDELAETVILRTAWVYSPFGRNFVRTMLELAQTRDRLTVVDDQHGNPTSALDLADAVLSLVATWQQNPATGLGQIYHATGTGETTWCGLAQHVCATSARLGGPQTEVAGIASDQWPTKAARPANSRLDCTKLARDTGYTAPKWQISVEPVVRRLLAAGR